MPAKKMIRVLAAPGLLYPHPDGARLGHRGWVGWVPCAQAEAEHTIEGAAGLATKPGPTGPVYDPENTTSDMFQRGPDIFLKRDPEGALLEETADIRRALACGDLLRFQEPVPAAPAPAEPAAPAIPPVPPLPRTPGGR